MHGSAVWSGGLRIVNGYSFSELISHKILGNTQAQNLRIKVCTQNVGYPVDANPNSQCPSGNQESVVNG